MGEAEPNRAADYAVVNVRPNKDAHPNAKVDKGVNESLEEVLVLENI